MFDHLFTAEQRRVKSLIVAHEWYREAQQARQARRYAADAAEAQAPDELVYE